MQPSEPIRRPPGPLARRDRLRRRAADRAAPRRAPRESAAEFAASRAGAACSLTSRNPTMFFTPRLDRPGRHRAAVLMARLCLSSMRATVRRGAAHDRRGDAQPGASRTRIRAESSAGAKRTRSVASPASGCGSNRQRRRYTMAAGKTAWRGRRERIIGRRLSRRRYSIPPATVGGRSACDCWESAGVSRRRRCRPTRQAVDGRPRYFVYLWHCDATGGPIESEVEVDSSMHDRLASDSHFATWQTGKHAASANPALRRLRRAAR